MLLTVRGHRRSESCPGSHSANACIVNNFTKHQASCSQLSCLVQVCASITIACKVTVKSGHAMSWLAIARALLLTIKSSTCCSTSMDNVSTYNIQFYRRSSKSLTQWSWFFQASLLSIWRKRHWYLLQRLRAARQKFAGLFIVPQAPTPILC